MTPMTKGFRTLSFFLGAAFLLGPLCVLAFESVSGGFPSGSIWMSKTTLVAGDSVQIFTPIYNAGGGKVDADAVFMMDDASIGSVHFTLQPGETKIASLAWSAKEGEHEVSAVIQNAADTDSKAPLSLSGDKTNKLSITVAAPPPQSAAAQVLGAAGSAVQSILSASLPAVSAAVSAVLTQTEKLRTQAAASLENRLVENTDSSGTFGTSSASKNQEGGQVLAAHTYRDPASVLAAAAAAPVRFTLVRMFEEILLFIIGYVWIFYPLLLLAIVFCLYLLAKRLARPQKARA